MKKFTVKEDWTPIKLDVAVEMPDSVDLNFLRGSGLQPGEELLPDGVTPPPPVYDTTLLDQLTDMGFPPNACKRALYFTENRSLEAATNWVMEHIADSDFDELFVPPGVDPKPGKDHLWYLIVVIINRFASTIVDYWLISEEDTFVVDQAALEMVTALGFTPEQATKALKATNNNLERAADWVFSHQAELEAQETDGAATLKQENFRDGSDRESQNCLFLKLRIVA